MGKLIYGDAGLAVDIDDRALAHLQVVMGSKLRRGESFFYSWRNDLSLGSGRNSVWVHPRMHLIFRYSGGRSPSLNTRWLDVLSRLANTPGGLFLATEPEMLTPPERNGDQHSYAS